jgi:hypothetical protein
MLKKLFFVISNLMLFSFVHAETCPSPSDLHHHNLHGWYAFDIDNGTPLSSARLDEYLQNAQQFVLAEWMEDAPEGSGHCYYEKTTSYTDYGNAFLAKQNLMADNSARQWTPQGIDVMHCKVSVNECRFVEK